MTVILVRLSGLAFALFAIYLFFGKQILMPIKGTTTTGTVVGFKARKSKTPQIENFGKKGVGMLARAAFVKFLPENAKDSFMVLSDGNSVLSFLNYDFNDKVTVAYWKNRPETATIISWREWPLMLILFLVGLFFLVIKIPEKFKR